MRGITGLQVDGFKCLQSIDFADMPHVTVIDGDGNSGKSSIIEALDMLQYISNRRLRMYSTQRGGSRHLFNSCSKYMTLRMSLKSIRFGDVTYHLRLVRVGDDDDRIAIATETLRVPGEHSLCGDYEYAGSTTHTLPTETTIYDDNMCEKEVLDTLRGITVYNFDTTKHAGLHNRCELDIPLHRDGRNIAGVLLQLRNTHAGRYSSLVSELTGVLPDFRDFVLDEKYGKTILAWEDKLGRTILPAYTSTSHLQTFCLMTALYYHHDDSSDRIICFDDMGVGMSVPALRLAYSTMSRLHAQTIAIRPNHHRLQYIQAGIPTTHHISPSEQLTAW